MPGRRQRAKRSKDHNRLLFSNPKVRQNWDTKELSAERFFRLSLQTCCFQSPQCAKWGRKLLSARKPKTTWWSSDEQKHRDDARKIDCRCFDELAKSCGYWDLSGIQQRNGHIVLQQLIQKELKSGLRWPPGVVCDCIWRFAVACPIPGSQPNAHECKWNFCKLRGNPMGTVREPYGHQRGSQINMFEISVLLVY